MGTAKPRRGDEGTLDPAAALSVAEAARLVDRPQAEIEEHLATGVLLSETRRQGGKEVQIIRAIDLQEAYPEHFYPRAGAGEAPRASGSDSVAAHAADASGPSLGPTLGSTPGSFDGMESTETVVEAVRTSDTSRDALIELCQDMETRLDLAERERQASTAALLMAQRRVLDLEVQQRKQPWARAGGLFAALASAAAIVIALRAPAAAREAAAKEIAPLRESAMEGIREAGESLAAQWGDQWQGALDAERSAADLERERFGETLRAAESSAEASAGAAKELAATSAATLARVEAGAQGVLSAAQAERAEAAREREELLAALDDLEQRLGSSEEMARKRSAELEVAHDNASRDRMRFRERLGDAERLLEDARLAMGASRRGQADERERLRQTTERLEAALSKVEARGAVQPANSLRQGEGGAVPAGPSTRPAAPIPAPSTTGGAAAPQKETREGSAKPSLGSILRALFG